MRKKLMTLGLALTLLTDVASTAQAQEPPRETAAERADRNDDGDDGMDLGWIGLLGLAGLLGLRRRPDVVIDTRITGVRTDTTRDSYPPSSGRWRRKPKRDPATAEMR